MTDNNTRKALIETVDSIMEDITEFARQIDAGEYGNAWTVYSEESEAVSDCIIANDEEDAIEVASRNQDNTDGWYAEHNDYDSPTIVDENGDTNDLDDWALSVEVKIGKPLQVWVSFGGPNILIESSGYQDTRLEGHWGRESVYRSGDQIETVFDYFVSDLYDSAPGEYK